MKSALKKLAEWYHAQCDDLWEHRWGISITTLDLRAIALETTSRSHHLGVPGWELSRKVMALVSAFL